MERQVQAGGFRTRAKGGAAEGEPGAEAPAPLPPLKVSLMKVDAATLTAGQCISLLTKLHQRLHRLRAAQPPVAAATAATAATAAARGDAAPTVSGPAAVKKRKAAGAAPAARGGKKGAAAAGAGSDAVSQLIAFGYAERVVRDALEETGGDVSAAAEWLLTNLA